MVIFAIMSKRKYYDITFKLRVVNCAGKESKEAAAKDFGVDTKRIRVSCSQKDSLIVLQIFDGL